MKTKPFISYNTIEKASTEELLAELKRRDAEMQNPSKNYRRIVGIMDNAGIESFIDVYEMGEKEFSHRFFALKLRTRYSTNRAAKLFTTWLPKSVCDIFRHKLSKGESVDAKELLMRLPNLKYLPY